MKKRILQLAMIFWAGILNSCGLFNDISPSGNQVTEIRELKSFQGIDHELSSALTIEEGDEVKVELFGSDNLLEVIETKVVDGLLRIQVESNIQIKNSDVRIHITMPEIESISQSGSGEVVVDGDYEIEDIDVRISGSGDVDLKISSIDKLELSISGSGRAELSADRVNESDVRISGSGRMEYNEMIGESIEVRISGSGKMYGFDLAVEDAIFDISGSGNAEITVSETLNAKISGSGEVRYKGQPKITKSVSGSGKVVDVN